MQRTISAMVGKGSVNHNSRKFRAENVDGTRTHLNIDYCNENIKTVYHELFDEALERYNAKQIRSDRKIKDYYEKIRSSKQEKPFHEIILQVGGKGNMNADTENGELAKQILDEYYQGFQERNPQLRVFSAHLHMDEATPHLHIDFVPFTTGSKRGLDTRVSLKQALATQGFKGGSRGDTEWSQWIQSEKEQLAAVMERYGIEWEHLGTHEKHLSVLDYKKQEREKEVAALGAKIEQKQIEFDVLSERVLNYDKAKDELSNLEIELDTAPKYQLPEPEKFMTAKAYKTKMAEPVVRKLKQLVKTVLARCFEGWDNYHSDGHTYDYEGCIERIEELKDMIANARGEQDVSKWEKDIDSLTYNCECIGICDYMEITEEAARIMKESGSDEIVYYSKELDMYIWGITHYGTSWKLMLTSIPIPEDNAA